MILDIGHYNLYTTNNSSVLMYNKASLLRRGGLVFFFYFSYIIIYKKIPIATLVPGIEPDASRDKWV